MSVVTLRPPTEKPLGEAAGEPSGGLDFTSLYERYFHEVERWLRALGAPPSEVADLGQEVFVVVQRKLARFDGGNVAGWLYTIAATTWKDHRRRVWFRSFFSKRVPLSSVELEANSMTPERAYEVTESWALARRVLAKMDERRRVALVLFEVEGCSGDEIAKVQDVPVATVWTRIHKARREFAEGLRELTEE